MAVRWNGALYKLERHFARETGRAAKRAMDAKIGMKRTDIAGIEQARAGGSLA